MQISDKRNDRSTATAEALLRARTNESLKMRNVFKTQPFSAVCWSKNNFGGLLDDVAALRYPVALKDSLRARCARFQDEPALRTVFRDSVSIEH